MELNGAGEGIQYITTEGGEQQQIFIQGGEGDMAGQSLLQGAQIIDGKLVLPQQYQYVTENGETVMLVYETPDGQQVVSENGEQIVFLDESQTQEENNETPAAESTEPQTTYIQQVGEDGQTFLQQVITTMPQEPQQTFIQVAAEDAQSNFVQQDAAEEAEQPPTIAYTTPDGTTAILNEQQSIHNVKPGQSLLLPTAVPSKTTPAPQAQIHVSEGGAGSSTVVMVTSDPNQVTSNMTFMEGEEATEEDQQENTQTENKVKFIEAGEAAQTIDYNQEGALEMNIQEGGPAETETLDTEQGQMHIRILKGDEEIPSSDADTPQPIAVMHMPASSTSQQVLDEAAGSMMMLQPDPEPEIEPFTLSDEPDEEGRITMIDPETGDLVKVMPEEQEEIPVLINPEEFEKEEEEEQLLEQDRFDPNIKVTMNKNTAEIRIGSKLSPNKATPKLLSTNTVVVKDTNKSKSMLDDMDDDDEDDDDDSDFDEENLTPKVVYERLLAQHRKTKECQVCGDMLDSYPQLKDHLMEHAGYNPCECQICGKILSTSSKRAQHERSHNPKSGDETGELKSPDGLNSLDSSKKSSPKKPNDITKKFECDICGRQMGRMEHLKRHKLLHKPGPTWRCIICEYSFKREDLVKVHIKKQHVDALEQESLQDLYETLDYEGEENHQHKSQWNPKSKNQRPGMTPKSNGPTVDDTPVPITASTPAATPKAAPKTPKSTPKSTKGATDVTPKQTPKTAPKSAKPKSTTSKAKVKPKLTVKLKHTPKRASAVGVRKSGRTPKPKKMDDTATEEEIKKAENEEFDEDAANTMDMDDEDDYEDDLPTAKQMKQDEYEESDSPETLTEVNEDELSTVEETVVKDTRRTIGKRVTVRFLATTDEPRGKKRKASSMHDEIEEVVILSVKGPKLGKGSMWKPFQKNRSTPSTPNRSTPSTPNRKESSGKNDSNNKAQNTKTPKTNTPKLAKGRKIGEVTLISSSSKSGRKSSSKKKQNVSDRFEDDDYVYYDDDDDFELDEEDLQESATAESESIEEEDELVVIKAPAKKKRGRKPGSGKKGKTGTPSGLNTPTRQVSGMKMPVVLLDNCNKKRKTK